MGLGDVPQPCLPSGQRAQVAPLTGADVLKLGSQAMGHVIVDLLAADIDRLEALWQELLEHHLAAAPHLAALGTDVIPQIPGVCGAPST